MNISTFYQLFHIFILNINFKRYNLFLDSIFIIPLSQIIFSGNTSPNFFKWRLVKDRIWLTYFLLQLIF